MGRKGLWTEILHLCVYIFQQYLREKLSRHRRGEKDVEHLEAQEREKEREVNQPQKRERERSGASTGKHENCGAGKGW